MEILELTDNIRKSVILLNKEHDNFDPVIDLVGNSRFVLLGEATHGSKEFYEIRAAISRRLIKEKGFAAIAVEADFPDTHRINQFIKGSGSDTQAIDSLGEFKRFPRWMWRNTEMVKFVDFLRKYNSELPLELRIGFYGLDLYSMYASIHAVISYLDKVDPDAANKAKKRYECFEQYGKEEDSYGIAMSYINKSCQQAAVTQLKELYNNKFQMLNKNPLEKEELFFAQQNARLAKNAEQYYREMFSGKTNTWNLRDQHMAEILEQISNHLEKNYGSGKVIVWAHNSHIGDARATDMKLEGELNLGQIIREKYHQNSFLIGFTTNNGTVSAASFWGGDVERKNIHLALHGSYEDLFRHVGDYFLLNLKKLPDNLNELKIPRLQRAIGVIYRPQSERISHYFFANIADQFDAVIHINTTNALEPLDNSHLWTSGEIPQTYKSGL